MEEYVFLNVYDRSGIPEAMAEPCLKEDLNFTLKRKNNLNQAAADKWVTGFKNYQPNKVIDIFESEEDAKNSFWDRTEDYFLAKMEDDSLWENNPETKVLIV